LVREGMELTAKRSGIYLLKETGLPTCSWQRIIRSGETALTRRQQPVYRSWANRGEGSFGERLKWLRRRR
jgi:hypothetical protein